LASTDTNYKSARLIARILSEVVSRGGNLLLNVSPTGDGEVPDIQVSRLRELGAWIATHGDAVLGVRPPPPSVDFAGPATMRGNHLYLHLIARPVESAIVRGIPIRRVTQVSLVGAGPLRYEVPLAAFDEHLLGPDLLGELIIEAPKPAGALIDVIDVEFDGPLT
jgi:alpha-L-fucosidase